MNIEKIKEKIAQAPNLSTLLGIEYYSMPEEDTCKAVMKVDERHRQIFGYLSGGASLALAENLAGVGSNSICPDKTCVGVNVNGNHLQVVHEGDTIVAIARLLRKGRTLHNWLVEIYNSAETLVCQVQVTNYVINVPQ